MIAADRNFRFPYAIARLNMRHGMRTAIDAAMQWRRGTSGDRDDAKEFVLRATKLVWEEAKPADV